MTYTVADFLDDQRRVAAFAREGSFKERDTVDTLDGSLRVVGVPDTPDGKEIDRIDVIVRLRDV